MPDFASQYLAIREKEGRTYSDQALPELPHVAANHPHFHEWQIRKASADRLIKDFKNKISGGQFLDLGCGNGWFSHQLATVPNAQVLGLDVEGPEIRQAARVFADLAPRLHFKATDIFASDLDDLRFDRITLGASIQYFPDLKVLLTRLRTLLKPNGEIHVFDSPFYPESELEGAKARSVGYYEGMGFPDLAQFYHHHSMQAATDLGALMKANPNSIQSKFSRKILGKVISPFPWLVFK